MGRRLPYRARWHYEQHGIRAGYRFGQMMRGLQRLWQRRIAQVTGIAVFRVDGVNSGLIPRIDAHLPAGPRCDTGKGGAPGAAADYGDAGIRDALRSRGYGR